MMTIFPILVFLLYIFSALNMPDYFADISIRLQHVCLQLTQAPNTVLKLRPSLICGTPLEGAQETLLLQKTQLLHWIVVSGGHLLFWNAVLIFIFQIISKNVLPRSLLNGLLLIYVFATGFQAPCVRSFFYLQAAQSDWAKRHSHSLHCYVLALCCSLVVQPQWLTSMSFYLSNVAGLGLVFCSNLLLGKQPLLSWPASFLILTFLSPLFDNTSLNSFLMNILMGPLAILLLPLSVLSLLGSFFELVFATYVQFFFKTLALWPLPPVHFRSNNWITLWLWLFFLFSLTHVVGVHFERRRSFETLA
jgi:ComEC/Rec2-related protein